jgi:hypothetical protein
VPTCTPMPAAKGRYVVSRSCGRQPSKNVSSVTTSAVKPAALARRRTDSVTSLLRGLFVRVSVKREWGERRHHRGKKGGSGRAHTNKVGTSGVRRHLPFPQPRWNVNSRSTVRMVRQRLLLHSPWQAHHLCPRYPARPRGL